MQTEHLKITGMSCGSCTRKVTDALSEMPGVRDVKVSLSSGDVSIVHDTDRCSPDQLITAIMDAGYGVKARYSGSTHQHKVSADTI